jgi:hypothetical protein
MVAQTEALYCGCQSETCQRSGAGRAGAGRTHQREDEAHLLLEPTEDGEQMVVRLDRIALHLVKLPGRMEDGVRSA